jgi:hypothetical protein
MTRCGESIVVEAIRRLLEPGNGHACIKDAAAKQAEVGFSVDQPFWLGKVLGVADWSIYQIRQRLF